MSINQLVLSSEYPTPSMVEAGFQVLQKSGLSDGYLEADKLVLAEIFLAMWRASDLLGDQPKENEN